MPLLFKRKTFQYFDLAKKNKKKKDYFQKNKEIYIANVKDPFGILLYELNERIGRKVPGVIIGPKKLSRPQRPKGKAEELGYTKASAMFFLSEKQSSIFEWNPGLFMQLGDEKPDNMIGVGLYGPTSRQTKRLRQALVNDYKTLDKILANKKLKKYWGSLADEKYKRFPKDFSPEDPAAKYLWYKQLFLRRRFTRKEVLSPGFADTVMNSFEAAVPFLQWVREAVGVFDKREYEREREDRRERQRDISAY